MDFLDSLEALSNQPQLVLRGLSSGLGFLLKEMEYIDGALKPHCVDGSVSVAIEVVYDLENSSSHA